MGAARPPCAGGPYRTARSQAADGHDHASTDGQRERAARTLTGAMVQRRALIWILRAQTRENVTAAGLGFLRPQARTAPTALRVDW